MSKSLGRLLRDTFVVGLLSSFILEITCKLLETFRKDADKISSSRHRVHDTCSDVEIEEIGKVSTPKKKIRKPTHL